MAAIAEATSMYAKQVDHEQKQRAEDGITDYAHARLIVLANST